MYLITEYETAVYHSHHWGDLVEQGYMTMYVEGGIAYMIRQR
jgi:hypothetical protein